MTSNPLAAIIASKGWCVADGATGPNLFARDAGAQIIGGCCGTSPAHVAAMVTALDGTARRPFDAAAMTTALGEAWAGLNTAGPAAVDKPSRGGRRGRRR